MTNLTKIYNCLGTTNIISINSKRKDIKNILETIEKDILLYDDKWSIYKENKD